MSDFPEVSVIMGVFQPEAGNLARTIQSVLDQSFGDFEFIIVQDDGSLETTSLLKKLEEVDARIHLLFNRENLGLVASLNKGLNISGAALIARIDVGDYWDVKKLEKQVRCFDKDKNLMVVGTQFRNYSPDEATYQSLRMPVSDGEIRTWLRNGRNPFIHSSVVFRRRQGIFYNRSALHTEDFELWCRYDFFGAFKNIDEVLTYYLIDSSSISSAKRYLMYANGTRVYRRFLINLKKPDRSEINNGFVLKPVYEMMFYHKWGSNLYTRGMYNLLKDNKITGSAQMVLSALINPCFLLEKARRSRIKSRFIQESMSD